MTKEEARTIEPGHKVYIWGNRDRAQKVVWRGLGTLGSGSPMDIRFETGMFFALDEPELIDFAPDDAETETIDMSTGSIMVQNGFSACEFFTIEAPVCNYRSQRSQFMIDHDIELSKFGYYTTFNPKSIEKFKKYQEMQIRYDQYQKATDLFNSPPNPSLLK